MYKYKECMVAQTQKFKIMYFHIMSSDNKSVISGELVLMRPHTTCSEINKTQCFLVYMHNGLINEDLFTEWSIKHQVVEELKLQVNMTILNLVLVTLEMTMTL